MTNTLPLHWNTEAGFEALFRALYAPLYRYASGLLADEMQAEEAVQEVFLRLWQQKDQVSIETNVQAYLYRAVHNQSMNILNHEKVKEKYQQYARHSSPQYADGPAQGMYAKELQQQIGKAMEKIPEKCRTVFHLSRQEELSYKEIAAKLGLSIKTVENQVAKALKILRAELKDYLPMLAVMVTIFKLFFKNGDL
jgi:RNA polymerase sigma-70 factor (ECF subfamily)